jgi:tryptophan 7-halogenase
LVLMPIEKIVIAGGGCAGWMAASALSRRLPPDQVSITVVEDQAVRTDDGLGIPSLAEPTLPSTAAYHDELGYNEDDILKASRGCFSLGRAVSGWTPSPAPAFHPYGDVGASKDAVPFHQMAAKLRADGATINLNNYAIAALCAQAGRFMRPPGDMRSPLHAMEYGIHLDTRRYAAFMKADACRHGARSTSGQAASLLFQPDGLMAAIKTQSGETFEGDFFIDCSGPAGDLVSKLAGSHFEDWRGWLPCDRSTSVLHQMAETPRPFAELAAHGSGWQRFVGLQNAEVETIIYADGYRESKGQDYQFTSGRRAPWIGNCLALGGAAQVIDPIASTQICLAQSAILRLLSLFPHGRSCMVEAAEFNRWSDEEVTCARDFAILHYKANRRDGEPFWDACRAMSVPETLAHRIALYENCGRVALYDGELFEASGWIAMFEALGVRPKRYDAMANAIPNGEIEHYFSRLREAMLKAVATMPSHADYLAHTGISTVLEPTA